VTDHERQRVRIAVLASLEVAKRVRIHADRVEILEVDAHTGRIAWMFHAWAWDILIGIETLEGSPRR
jgi:hypothetical protein